MRQQAHICGNNVLGGKINPNANVCLGVGVVRQQFGAIGGIGVLEKFAKNKGLVKCLSLILDSRDQTLWVDIYENRNYKTEAKKSLESYMPKKCFSFL